MASLTANETVQIEDLKAELEKERQRSEHFKEMYLRSEELRLQGVPGCLCGRGHPPGLEEGSRALPLPLVRLPLDLVGQVPAFEAALQWSPGARLRSPLSFRSCCPG